MKAVALVFFLLGGALAAKPDYDPSSSKGSVSEVLTSFCYGDREVPLKIYLPEQKPAPVILLSHGLGGSREVGAYLGNHWAGRGYLVVAMQHVGSDESVWQDAGAADRMRKLEVAANRRTFLDRTKDVPATLDQLEKWNVEKGHVMNGRMDLSKVGMTGHSYGAVTTQAACGQNFGPLGQKYMDARIDAGVALSPSVPKVGDARQAFGKVSMPMMLMTGTKDSSLIGRTTPESRRMVYEAMPAGSKYELVLKDAEHMAFSDASVRGMSVRNPNHHRVIQALSAAFWDACLREDQAAIDWLKSKEPGKLLEAGDLWLRK